MYIPDSCELHVLVSFSYCSKHHANLRAIVMGLLRSAHLIFLVEFISSIKVHTKNVNGTISAFDDHHSMNLVLSPIPEYEDNGV